MSDKTYVLSLSADTFNAFKMDFDSALQRLLQKMDRLQSDSASINCKISVALTPAPERNFDATREGDTVQVMKPAGFAVFEKHNICFVFRFAVGLNQKKVIKHAFL